MNRDQWQSAPEPSLAGEDYQERGLRILGRSIARYLLRQREGCGDKTCNQKEDDLPPPGTTNEDVS